MSSRRCRLRLVVPCFALASVGVEPLAHAAGAVFGFGDTFVPIGLNLGHSLSAESSGGFLIGGEASVVRLARHQAYFYGGFADCLYDSGSRTRRISLGPELGLGFMRGGSLTYAGVDLGTTLEVGREQMGLGCRPRLFITYMGLSLYAGESIPIAGAGQRFLTELGLLLKFPVPVELF